MNLSKIKLKECEKIKKDEIDAIQEGFKKTKIEYEVYTIFNHSNLLKLNLSFCDNDKINNNICSILN